MSSKPIDPNNPFSDDDDDDSLSVLAWDGEEAEGEIDAKPAAVVRPPAEVTVPAVSIYDKYMYVDCTHDTAVFMRSAARMFLECAESNMACLFAMSLGIPTYAGILNQEPFSLSKQKKVTCEYTPSNTNLQDEVRRRSYFFSKDNNTKEQKPTYWRAAASRAWLIANPMKLDTKDTAFFSEAIAGYTTTLSTMIRSNYEEGAKKTDYWKRS
jgi:hypothetical protein